MAAQPYEYTKNYSIVILLRDLDLNFKTAWVNYYSCCHFTDELTETEILVVCLSGGAKI